MRRARSSAPSPANSLRVSPCNTISAPRKRGVRDQQRGADAGSPPGATPRPGSRADRGGRTPRSRRALRSRPTRSAGTRARPVAPSRPRGCANRGSPAPSAIRGRSRARTASIRWTPTTDSSDKPMRTPRNTSTQVRTPSRSRTPVPSVMPGPAASGAAPPTGSASTSGSSAGAGELDRDRLGLTADPGDEAPQQHERAQQDGDLELALARAAAGPASVRTTRTASRTPRRRPRRTR